MPIIPYLKRDDLSTSGTRGEKGSLSNESPLTTGRIFFPNIQ